MWEEEDRVLDAYYLRDKFKTQDEGRRAIRRLNKLLDEADERLDGIFDPDREFNVITYDNTIETIELCDIPDGVTILAKEIVRLNENITLDEFKNTFKHLNLVRRFNQLYFYIEKEVVNTLDKYKSVKLLYDYYESRYVNTGDIVNTVRKMLISSKDLRLKGQLIGLDENDLGEAMEFEMENKGGALEESKRTLGEILSICEKEDINVTDYIYRIEKGLTEEEAISLGIEDKERYGVNFEFDACAKPLLDLSKDETNIHNIKNTIKLSKSYVVVGVEIKHGVSYKTADTLIYRDVIKRMIEKEEV